VAQAIKLRSEIVSIGTLALQHFVSQVILDPSSLQSAIC
jgi:hypothetical protein